MGHGDRWAGLRARWRTIFAWRRVEAELNEELRDHLERKAAAYQERGWHAGAARRQARLDLGGLEPAKERCRDQRRLQWLHDLAADLRHGWRLARKSPGFTLAAVLTLALGIGPNAILFSVVNGLFFRPLPVPQAHRLVLITARLQQGGFDDMLPYPALAALRRETRSIFSSVAGGLPFGSDSMGWRGGAPAQVDTNYVTGNFFAAMGIHPALGRLIIPAGAGGTAARPVAVLSYRFWRDRFAASPGVIGSSARINGQEVTIIGVAPRGFRGIVPLAPPQVYLPLGMAVQTGDMSRHFAAAWRSSPLSVLARLRPGISRAQAQAELQVIAHRWAAEYPPERRLASLRAPVLNMLAFASPASAGAREAVAGLFLLLAGLVLAVAAVNLAGLLLARAAARSPEMALRAALGAGRGRLLRQGLAESLVVGALGGAAGLGLAALALGWLASFRVGGGIITLDFSIGWRVCAYTAAAAAAAGLLAGIAPALRAARAGTTPLARERAATAAPGGQRLRTGLIAAEIAGTLALLTVAGLFVRSLWSAQHAPLGFQARGVVNFTVGLQQGRRPEVQLPALALAGRILTRARALPGITSAALARTVPAGYTRLGTRLTIPGDHPRGAIHVNFNAVSPGYFRTLGIRLLRGRGFRASGGPHASAVAIVNQAMAAQYWPGRDALGQIFYADVTRHNPVRVIAIAANSHTGHLYGPYAPYLYLPLAQYSAPMPVILLVRSQLPASVLAPEIRRLIRQLAPHAPVYDVATMSAALNGFNGYGAFLVGAWLAAGLGLLALLLSLVGIYGAIAYATSLRRREMGIRLALGAQPGQILALLLRRGLAVVAIGVAAGIALALGFGALASGLFYGVSGHDPLTFALAAAIMAAAALAACYLPACRGLHAAPIAALRQE